MEGLSKLKYKESEKKLSVKRNISYLDQHSVDNSSEH